MRVNAKLTFAAVTLLLGGAARADINLPFAPPPSPLSRTVEVPEGGRIDIPLTLTGAPSGRTLDFVIRIPPTKGRLDPIRNSVGGDSAAVTYTHNPAQGGGRDQFTFAVQRAGGGVSSSATIDIRIAENPPRLLVLPALVDFGPVALGAPPQRAQFTLANQGGGVAAGRIILQPPFQLEGDDTYRLSRGQRKLFAVLFQPPRPSAFEGEVRFGASFDQILRLTGSGLPTDPTPNPAASTPAPSPSTLPVAGQLPVAPTPTPTAEASALPSPTPLARPTPEPEPTPAESAGASEELLAANIAGGAVPLQDFRMDVNLEKRTVVASWIAPPAASAAGLTYRVERREIYFDNARSLQARWLPVKLDGTPARVGPRLSVPLLRLPAGRVANLRVVAVAADNTLRGYSAFEPVDVPPASGTWWYFLAAAAAGLIVGGAIWRRIRA